jgi:hypothetical protein
MLLAACEQFLGKTEDEIQQVALETLEGHQRAIMGSMTVEVGHHDNYYTYKSLLMFHHCPLLKRKCVKFVTLFNPIFTEIIKA